MVEFFSTSDMELEYIEIVHPDTLVELSNEWVEGATACIVAYCGNVRLIDNLELIPYS
jgi:pantoate--beta-alanine ligase